jgi:hypothetical protein
MENISGAEFLLPAALRCFTATLLLPYTCVCLQKSSHSLHSLSLSPSLTASSCSSARAHTLGVRGRNCNKW